MMNNSNVFSCIALNASLPTPKYLQIANSITDSIRNGRIMPAQTMPSISELEINLEISKKTAERCYRYLRVSGILNSIPGKGFFVNPLKTAGQIKVFLLVNKLSDQKNMLYNAFVETMGKSTTTDIYIYNDNATQFQNIIRNRKEYDYYVIIPCPNQTEHLVGHLLNEIPRDKLIIIGQEVKGLPGKYASVTENVREMIFKGLTSVLEKLRKYHTIELILPEEDDSSNEFYHGFKRFCICHRFDFRTTSNVDKINIKEGVAYINLAEGELVQLIEKISETNLMVGSDVGLISFHDSPLKRIILNGITTISTDFWQMGVLAAQLIQQKSVGNFVVNSKVVLRGSL